MRFVPDYTLNILKEEGFAESIGRLTEQLDDYRVSGYFDSHDSKPLFYEYFLAEGSKGSVVIVHGLSEFTKKYYELAYYFLNQGYNVFLYDQRCHGYSCRLTDDADLIHVDRFEDYALDLDCFINNIVIKADDKPIYILSHSMGGAVTALYLAKHPQTVKAAVLSSPLIAPKGTYVHPTIARMWARMTVLLHGNKLRFKFAHDFDPESPHKKSSDSSKGRFEHNMRLRCSDAHYQTSPTTVGWILNSLTAKRKLLSRRVAGSINTPLLLLSAQEDSVVMLEPQIEFAKRCRACRMELFKGAKHTLFSAEHDILADYMQRVLDFFD